MVVCGLCYSLVYPVVEECRHFLRAFLCSYVFWIGLCLLSLFGVKTWFKLKVLPCLKWHRFEHLRGF